MAERRGFESGEADQQNRTLGTRDGPVRCRASRQCICGPTQSHTLSAHLQIRRKGRERAAYLLDQERAVGEDSTVTTTRDGCV
jgi:hypothetical protein